MSRFVSVLVLLILVPLLAVFWKPELNPLTRFGFGPTVVSSTGPTVEELKKLAVLTSLKIHVGDVIEAEGEGYKGAWIVKGDALVGVDLAQAEIESDPTSKRATIALPNPHVVMARVDQEKSRTYDVSSSSLRNWVPGLGGDEGKLRDQAMRKAQIDIEEIAASKEYIGMAKESAEQCIRTFFKITGWEVEVEWHPTKLPPTTPNLQNSN